MVVLVLIIAEVWSLPHKCMVLKIHIDMKT